MALLAPTPLEGTCLELDASCFALAVGVGSEVTRRRIWSIKSLFRQRPAGKL